jgi:sulfatase modifying factor 1
VVHGLTDYTGCQPGNRRYKDEDKSDRTIGFRCAMIRVGGQAGNEDVGGNNFKESGKKSKEDINNF